MAAFPPAGRSRSLGAWLLAAGVTLSACTDRAPIAPTDDLAGPSAPTFDVTTLQQAPEYVPGEILVRFRPGAARSEIAQANRARPKDELAMERVWVLEVDPGDELDAVGRFRNNPNIEFAEPNYVYTVVPCAIGDCTLPSDPGFGAKWDLHNTGFVTNAGGSVVATTGAKGADIAWLEAYEHVQQQGGATGAAVLGILDTGIWATHEDFAGKILPGRNFCPSILCLIGGVNPNTGWNTDDNGHGTHVAGIATANGNNGRGTPGVAWMDNVKILPVRVCGGALGVCNAAGITNGIIWAVDNGAHVLNLSLGGGAPSAATQNALRYALQNNVLPICASGNDGAETVSFPAAFPECMAVASSSWSDERASYSNAGPEIEVAAPGGDLSDQQPHSLILAAYRGSNTSYAYLAGTSMATPQVAGLAVLLRAAGLTSAADIRARIRETADDRGAPGFDNAFGHGRINVYRALTQNDPRIDAEIDIRPGSTVNPVNLRSTGQLPVALLNRPGQTFDFDAIDLSTIRLGGAAIAMRPNGTYFAAREDVDGDGLADWVFHFSVPTLRATGSLSMSTTQLELRGDFGDGRRFRGADVVNVLP